MYITNDLGTQIMREIDNANRLSVVKPINLNPPGGIYGQISQSNVTFDNVELVDETISASGVSLLTNMNRIRAGVSLGDGVIHLRHLGDDIVFSGGGGGHVIEYNSTPLTQRSKLNFVGSGISVTDDSGNDATVITITASGVGGVTDHGALTGLSDDDHTQYQLRSEKGTLSGYASLDGTTKVPFAQLPTGTGSSQVAIGSHAHSSSIQSPSLVQYDSIGADYEVVTDNSSYNAFPGLIKASNGTLILVYRKATNHTPSKGTIVQRNSIDGGLTWSSEATIVNHATYDARDPSLTLLANGDLVLSYSLYNQILEVELAGDQGYIIKSTDDGETWGSPVAITTNLTSWSFISAPIVELANGDLIAPVYGKNTGDTYWTAKVSKSTNAGATWANLATLANGETLTKLETEPNVVLMDDGTLVCVIRSISGDLSTQKAVITTSTDSGATWSAVTTAFDLWGNPGLLHLSGDRLLILSRQITNLKIFSSFSYDAGSTWTDGVILDNSTYTQMDYARGVEVHPGLTAVAYSVKISDTNADIRLLWLGGNYSEALVGSSITVYRDDISIVGGGQFISTTPSGIAPLIVASPTLITNLNADMLDGLHASSFIQSLPNFSLSGLSDVNITDSTTGDVLYNNAGTWEDYPLGLGSKITTDGSKIKFGNVAGGNYLEIDTSTGNLRLSGAATTWDDFRVEASIVKPGATAPQYKAFGPSGSLQALMFEAGHHDESMFEVQLPHNWKEGSNIYPHVHWTPTTADAGNVVWELEYVWSNIGGTFGAPSNMASDATAAGGTAWVHKLTYLKSGGNNYIDGTGKTLSSMLLCRLHRNSNSGSDTLNKDVAFLEIDFHYQIDSFGSDEELIKDASASLLLETGDFLLLESGDKLLLE